MLKNADDRFLRGASIFHGVQGLMRRALVNDTSGEFISSITSFQGSDVHKSIMEVYS